MTIKYTWSFPTFECAPSADGLTDVVKIVHWIYSGVDGSYSNSLYGSVLLDNPQSNNFIPFEQLSQNTVISWVLDKVTYQSLSEMKSIISTNINNQKNPPIVSKPAPWN